MPAAVQDHPDLFPLAYPPAIVDPRTGVRIPKQREANLRWRRMLWRKCAQDVGWQRAQLELCAASILYWLNAWVWTYKLRTVDVGGVETPVTGDDCHIPLITWPVQDHAVEELVDCVDHGKDAIIDKSREMTASWVLCGLAAWYWRFRRNSRILVVSRIEDLVDKVADSDSLFWKIDYIHRWVPVWMLPTPERAAYQRDGKYRTHMHLHNPVDDCSIDGQATTAHVGRGGRRLFVALDEMASIQHDTAAWESAADTTSCRIGNSTPVGEGTEFTRQRNLGIQTGRPKVITLGYWNHPEKGRGREQRVDHDGSITGIAGSTYWWTPYFDEQVRRRHSKRDIGQNLLINHQTAGRNFFNTIVVTRHMQRHAREPRRCAWHPTLYRFIPSERGAWFLWCELDERTGLPRIATKTNFCAFSDLSSGKGEANATCAVQDRETGEVVAEFVDPNLSPHELAGELCPVLQIAFPGQTGEPFYGWESNGPGEAYYKYVLQTGYRYVYYQRETGKRGERQQRDYGWRSTNRSKQYLLDRLDQALAAEGILIHSQAGLDELMTYIVYDDGSIGPGHLKDETTGARAAHGDRVIAYAGVNLMRAEAPHYQPAKQRYPSHTLGHIAGHDELENPTPPQQRRRDPFGRRRRQGGL